MNDNVTHAPPYRILVEDCLNRLLKSDKPKIIAGSFKSKEQLTDEMVKHFSSNPEYLWQLYPHDKNDEYKGMHMGVLLDESLNYVHIVFATNEMMNYLLNLKYEK
jgi:hypothetical protein